MTDQPIARAEVHGLITPDEMRRWRHPSGPQLAVDLIGPWIQIAAAITVSALAPHPLVLALAFFVIAGALHGVNCITHEFAHRLVFPRRPRLNDFVGRWFFGAPGALPLDLYRRRHFEHHRFVSTAEDTKKLYQRDFAGWRMAREVFLGAVGIDYLWQVITVLGRKSEDDAGEPEQAEAAGKRDDKGEGRTGFVADVLPVAIVQLAIAAVFIWRWDFVHYLVLWPWPLMGATLFGKLRSVVEHTPFRREWCDDPASPYFRHTPEPVLRSVVPTRLERLFLTKVNFSYHREHHLWPALSYQFLPVAYERVRQHLNEPIERGYVTKLTAFTRGV